MEPASNAAAFGRAAGAPLVKQRIIRCAKYLILILWAFTTIFPLYWTLVNAFRTNSQIFTTFTVFPEDVTYLNNFRMVLQSNLPLGFWNSVTMTSMGLGLLLICAVPCAFLLTSYRFKAAKYIHTFFIMGIVIPRLSVMIATYTNFQAMGFLGKQYPIVFCYAAFEMPLTIFLLTGFMKSLPSSVLESGIIDGCNSFNLLGRLVLPMSRNGIVTVIILSSVSIWNEFAYSMVFLANVKFKTLTLMVADAKSEYSVEYGMMSAGVIVAVVPIIIVYCFLQDKIINGMVLGAVKG